MNLLLIMLAWLLIGAVFVVGIVLATKGIFWLLILCSLAFIAAFARWGCATH